MSKSRLLPNIVYTLLMAKVVCWPSLLVENMYMYLTKFRKKVLGLHGLSY